MENASPTNPQAGQKNINAKVAGLGFVILAVLLHIVPTIMYVAMPVLISDKPEIANITTIVIAAIVGFIVGFKTKEKAWLNSLLTAILITLYAQIGLVVKMGIEPLLQYALSIGLPVLIAGIIGGFVGKSKSN